MRSVITAAILLVVVALPSLAQPTTVFSGRPSIKVSEGGTERVAEQVSQQDAINLASVISEIGGNYYWASRENTELARVQSGAFITFIAFNGSGYVRIIEPTLKGAAALMSDTAAQFDYVEHVLLGWESVTYYGTSQ